MDPEFDRGERAATNMRMLFESVVGCDEIVTQLEGYQKTVANMKARDMDPREQIPFNFLFRGPPGEHRNNHIVHPNFLTDNRYWQNDDG